MVRIIFVYNLRKRHEETFINCSNQSMPWQRLDKSLIINAYYNTSMNDPYYASYGMIQS